MSRELLQNDATVDEVFLAIFACQRAKKIADDGERPAAAAHAIQTATVAIEAARDKAIATDELTEDERQQAFEILEQYDEGLETLKPQTSTH